VDRLPGIARALLDEVKADGLNADGVLGKLVRELDKRCAKLRPACAKAEV
jgi:hypothetical protein